MTLALTAVPIRLAGANPPAAFQRYLVTPLTSTNGLYEVLLTATPLMFTGMAVAVAFRAGYWNIGAEGQFLLGAIGTTASPGTSTRPWRFRAGADSRTCTGKGTGGRPRGKRTRRAVWSRRSPRRR